MQGFWARSSENRTQANVRVHSCAPVQNGQDRRRVSAYRGVLWLNCAVTRRALHNDSLALQTVWCWALRDGDGRRLRLPGCIAMRLAVSRLPRIPIPRTRMNNAPNTLILRMQPARWACKAPLRSSKGSWFGIGRGTGASSAACSGMCRCLLTPYKVSLSSPNPPVSPVTTRQ
jgi:hypothetical protein